MNIANSIVTKGINYLTTEEILYLYKLCDTKEINEKGENLALSIVKNSFRKNIIELLDPIIKDSDLNVIDNKKYNFLNACYKKVDLTLIEYALMHGADPNSLYTNGNPILTNLMSKKFKNFGKFILDALKLFEKYGADINVQNKYGQTPFLLSCKDASLYKSFEYLLKKSDVHHVNNYNENAFNITCKLISEYYSDPLSKKDIRIEKFLTNRLIKLIKLDVNENLISTKNHKTCQELLSANNDIKKIISEFSLAAVHQRLKNLTSC